MVDPNTAISAVQTFDSMFGSSGEHAARQHDARQRTIQNRFNKAEAAIARNWASSEAELARQFSAQQSNTAVQRRMEDMRKAGINPLLAGKFDATSPAGATVSGGPTASGNASPSARPAKALKSQMVNQALQAGSSVFDAKTRAFQANENAKKIEADVNKITQEINNLKTDDKYKKALTQMTATQTEKLAQEILAIKAEIELKMENTKGKSYENVAKKILAEWRKENPEVVISQDLGVDGKTAVDIVQTIVLGVIGYSAFGKYGQAFKNWKDRNKIKKDWR